MKPQPRQQHSARADLESVAVLETADSLRPRASNTREDAGKRPTATHVPSSRGARLLHMGRLAGGLAGGAIAEGVRRLANGRPLAAKDLLLTPSNAARLSERLAQLRGAAMKVGQLVSMEAGELLPPEFTSVLERLRDDAHAMPLGQVADILNEAWGDAWEKRFRRFVFTPLAAASIGQVHEAITGEQQHLAVKIQYPQVRDSIDSDVDNVTTLLRFTRMMPSDVEFTPLLEEAKRQLHREADYITEAAHIENFRSLLAEDPDFYLPKVFHDLTTPQVLSMSFVPGVPIDSLNEEPASLRNRIAHLLLALALRECFEWGLVQTDPNFANYRYDHSSGRIGLLDFGATRRYTPSRVMTLRRLLSAAVRKDRNALEQIALEAGYLDAGAPAPYRDSVTDLLMLVTEPTRQLEPYDFAATDLATRMSEIVIELRLEQRYWHLPPVDILFLHRKLGGLYLMCSRLGARVDVRNLVGPYLV